jgi:hypothetical protein
MVAAPDAVSSPQTHPCIVPVPQLGTVSASDARPYQLCCCLTSPICGGILTVVKLRQPGQRRVIWTPELAAQVLADSPTEGWAHRKGPHPPDGRVPFAKVPKARRHVAAQKLADLLARWRLQHPGQTMSPQKYASLHGNAVNYALHIITRRLLGHCGIRAKFRKAARRYLASLQLQEFKSQPLKKRVKLLI